MKAFLGLGQSHIGRQSNDVLLKLEGLGGINEPDVVLDKLDLLLERSFFRLSLNFVERFRHNCDEHIHTNDQNQE